MRWAAIPALMMLAATAAQAGPGQDDPPSYLSVSCGRRQASPYCRERDGADSSGRMRIDYGRTMLSYRLPYLNPAKHYLAEIVAFQESSDVARQSLTFGRGKAIEMRLQRGIPETLRFVIPQTLYDSTRVNLRVSNLEGRRVSLAGLRLFEFETPGKRGDAGLSGVQAPQAGELALSAFPNPFSGRTTIRYALPEAGPASVSVVDAIGRVVRRLEVGVRPAGEHLVRFDGRDDAGRTLPRGVYFIRLTTTARSLIGKLVLLQ